MITENCGEPKKEACCQATV